MRILFLTFYFTPDLCAGSFRAAALIEELQKFEDVKLDIVTTKPNRYAQFKQKASSFENLTERTRVHRIDIPKHQSGLLDQMISFLYYFRLALSFAKNKEYDLVFATSSRLFTAFLAARISKRLKTPLYLDIRDIFSKSTTDILRKKKLTFLRVIIDMIENYTFSRAKRINLVSPGFIPYIEAKYPNALTSTYTNGIDDIFLNHNFSKRINQRRQIQILYAGNIGEGQGLHKILPGFSKKLGNEVEIIVIGDGGKRQNLVNAIEEQKCMNVRIIPPVSRRQLLDYYQKCDILMLHLNDTKAFEEVIPSKLFEYAATGKPILAGVKGFSRHFILENIENCKVFDPCDQEGCVNAYEGLTMENVDRTKFSRKYSLLKIMSEMSLDIMNTNLEKAN